MVNTGVKSLRNQTYAYQESSATNACYFYNFCSFIKTLVILSNNQWSLVSIRKDIPLRRGTIHHKLNTKAMNYEFMLVSLIINPKTDNCSHENYISFVLIHVIFRSCCMIWMFEINLLFVIFVCSILCWWLCWSKLYDRFQLFYSFFKSPK